jgi:hypothetical protein
MYSYRSKFFGIMAPEILLLVLEYLDQADLANLALSCKRLHNMAQEYLHHHISLNNDKDALIFIRNHHLAAAPGEAHVMTQTKSLALGHIGKVKLLTILKACSNRLKHLSINCRLLSRVDQLDICDFLRKSRLTLETVRLKDPQPEFVEAIAHAQHKSPKAIQTG